MDSINACPYLCKHSKLFSMQFNTRIPVHKTENLGQAYYDARDQFELIPLSTLDVFHRLINKQFADLSKKINFIFVNNEPYGENPLIEDVVRDFRRGKIFIHTTGNNSRIWGKFHNLQFRAIHDYIHCLHEKEFNHASECEVHRLQSEFSLIAYSHKFPYLDWNTYLKVLRSEIVYQSAYKEVYGKFHIDQKIILDDLI